MERSLEYNTQRVQLKLREYGRNVQNLVAHLKTIKDNKGKKYLLAAINNDSPKLFLINE